MEANRWFFCSEPFTILNLRDMPSWDLPALTAGCVWALVFQVFWLGVFVYVSVRAGVYLHAKERTSAYLTATAFPLTATITRLNSKGLWGGGNVKIYCLTLCSTSISEQHVLSRTQHKSGHSAMWLAKNVSFCIETVCHSMLLSITGFGIILTLDAFVFFSKCRMVMCSVGRREARLKPLRWKIETVLWFARLPLKVAINCLVWQHSGHQLSLNIKFPENKRCFLSWRQSLSTMMPQPDFNPKVLNKRL